MSDYRVTAEAEPLLHEIRDKSVRVIDVRKEAEYARDHIPGAASFPLSDLLSDDGAERVARIAGKIGVDDETRVVVYDDTFGALASRVAWTLEYIGHADARILGITYGRWKELELDTENTPAEISPREHSVKKKDGIIATVDSLEDAGGTVLLDNRERLNYLEQHIPGALNIPYRTLASEHSVLRPADDLRRLFGNRGITGESNVITYCGSVGTLSGLGYYALKSAGVSGTRLYVRSFKEWKSLNKPVAKQEDANYWDLSAE